MRHYFPCRRVRQPGRRRRNGKPAQLFFRHHAHGVGNGLNVDLERFPFAMEALGKVVPPSLDSAIRSAAPSRWMYRSPDWPSPAM